MSTEPAPAHLNPDQLLARLIEMEGVIERQKVALNALDDERNGLKSERDHFKGAFEEAERQRLELVIRQLLRAQFGRKSERLDPAQFQLTLENLEQEIAAATAAQEAPRQEAEDSDANRRPRRAPARRNLGHLPAHLERYQVVIEPEDRSCPCCGGALHQIGVEERLDAVPLRLRVRVTRRPIYGCRSCAEAVVQAPAPDSAIPGGLPTDSVLHGYSQDKSTG
jgi:transposase